MGNAESVDIPGGGTEGYHVLRVSFNNFFLKFPAIQFIIYL